MTADDNKNKDASFESFTGLPTLVINPDAEPIIELPDGITFPGVVGGVYRGTVEGGVFSGSATKPAAKNAPPWP